MIQWVSNERATIAKLAEHGQLWIVNKLPPLGLPPYNVWEISVQEGDTLNKLIRRWANTTLPPGNEASEQRFADMIKASDNLALVLQDAHLLQGEQLQGIRLFAEHYAPVILVGDVLTIGAKVIDTKNATEFMQEAKFCITPKILF